jgi:hypothetical protein
MRSLILILPIALLFIACGKDSGGSSSSPTISMAQEEQVTDGQYLAVLRPLNTQVSGYFPFGNAEIDVTGDEFEVVTYLDDDAQVKHMQSVHAGTRCPEQKDDTNSDGFVDINEAMAVVGKVLLPLDSDLFSQKAGEGEYPRGTSPTYTEVASLTSIMEDLKNRTEEVPEHLMKLEDDQNLAIVGKVVLVLGTSDQGTVPETVTSAFGLSRHETLPIVCGVIEQVKAPATP